jgi:ureidoacrylate peracid hydrolase
VISTHFTLIAGRDGEPMVDPHLRRLRPFLAKGDFAPGSWGHALVDELQPADFSVEKVAYSAFHQTRLEWVLRKAGVSRLLVSGIVTNGGVTSTARDAHVREYEVTVLSDGCAAFTDALHETALASLASIARITTVGEALP